MGRRSLLALGLSVLALSIAGPAAAATSLHDIELDGLVSSRAVRDRVIEDSDRAVPGRIETFVDAHGHRITVGTDIPLLDLSGYAAVLAQTLHGAEISDLFVEVVPWEAREIACGPGAVGCYLPSQRRMIVTNYDPAGVNELVHTIVHEYGHHLDTYLENLGHLVPVCTGGDGSRSWWWVRVPDRFTCDNPTWELLIAELYAEDYAATNGIVGWQLTTIGPPTPFVQSQLVYDFNTRFVPRAFRLSAVVRRHRWKIWTFTVNHWTWLTATLRGPNRADLDLYLYRRGGRRPLRGSWRLGSSERIEYTLRPGSYEIAMWAERARGRGTIRLALE